MILKQLGVGGFDMNFSYVVFDEITGEGMVVDPCGDVKMILESIEKNKIKVKYILNTHGHRDHTEGNQIVSQAEKPVSTIGYEKFHNPYYQCRSKEEFLKLRRKGI